MRKETNVVTERTEVEKFELKIPLELDRKPDFIVPLSATRAAHIFKDETIDKEGLKTTFYKLYTISLKSGRPVEGRYHYQGQTYSALQEIKFALINLSAQLNVKKRIRKDELSEVDDDE